MRARTSAGPTYRTRKHIHILEPIGLDVNGNRLELAAGEVIEMGFTYKFTLDHLHRLLDAHGWNVVEEFDDGKAENALLLAQTR